MAQYFSLEKIKSMRKRCWFLTWNNPPENFHEQIIKYADKWAFQLEKGEKGTPHGQGRIYFLNAKTGEQVINMFPGIWIQPSVWTVKGEEYGLKDEGRLAGPWVKGAKGLDNSEPVVSRHELSGHTCKESCLERKLNILNCDKCKDAAEKHRLRLLTYHFDEIDI